MEAGDRRSKPSERGIAWRRKAAETRDKLGLPLSARPWTGLPGVQLRGIRTDRCREVIDLCWALARKQRPHASLRELRELDLWAAVNNEVDRLPLSRGAPTITSGSQLYSYKMDTVISAQAQLQLMGWPRHVGPAESFSEGEVQDLVGNSFSVPVIAHVCYAIYLCPLSPWWT